MKKKQKTMLLWVGGLAALYFLTRSKTTAPPVRKNTNFPQAQPSSAAPSASAMGSPYRDATV